MKNKYIGLIIGIVLIVLSIVVISFNGKIPDYKIKSVDDWYNDIESGKEVLTVFGASYCSHCQEYYPIISKLANKYKVNLYFFEIDNLEKENKSAYDKLMNSYEIKDFSGSVPFTFIMKNKNYINYTSGFVSRDFTIDFLKQNSLIKN